MDETCNKFSILINEKKQAGLNKTWVFTYYLPIHYCIIHGDQDNFLPILKHFGVYDNGFHPLKLNDFSI